MLFANVCAGFIRSCYGEFREWHFFWFFGFSSVSCVLGECYFCWSPFCTQDLGSFGVPPAGHVFLALFSGGITFGTTGGNVRQLIKEPVIFVFIGGKPYMLASVGRPSLHCDDACMVYWNKGALRRNCRLK